MTDTVTDLISKWPEPHVSNFARDLGITVEHAATIKRRGSIPVKYWPRLVDGCKERGIRGVNYDVLVSLHAVSSPTEAA